MAFFFFPPYEGRFGFPEPSVTVVGITTGEGGWAFRRYEGTLGLGFGSCVCTVSVSVSAFVSVSASVSESGIVSGAVSAPSCMCTGVRGVSSGRSACVCVASGWSVCCGG